MAGPLLPVLGVVETQIFMTLANRTTSVRMFWQDGHGEEYTTGDVHDLTNEVGTEWGANIMTQLSHDLEMVEIVGTDLSASDAPRTIITTSTVGSNSNPAEPLNVAAVISFVPLRRYKGGRYHIYLPGAATGFRTNEGYWTGGFDSGLATAYGDFLTAVQSGTSSHGSHWEQCGVSRFHAHAERVPPFIDTFSGNFVQPRICTRRRRLPKITA